MAKDSNIFERVGRSGLNRWQGFISEEYVKELQGKKGIQSYKEMSDNDSVIGSVLLAIKLLIRQASWTVTPGGNKPLDKEAAEFVESCMDDMEGTWSDLIGEILSFLVFGFSVHEIVYKRRLGKNKDGAKDSKYDDGLIAWRKLGIRAQETIDEWAYDEESDELTGLYQTAPPSYNRVFIPKEKFLHFRTESVKDNPEGRSILRTAYRAWYFKKRIEEIEGIGIERDLAGLPIMTPPEGVDIWDKSDPDAIAALQAAEKIVTHVRRDSQEGIVKPFGWTLELLSTGGRRNFDTTQIIERYDTRIAMTMLADFILLGHQNVGSFALSSDKTDMFGYALGTFMDIISETFSNEAIPRLIDLNWEHFEGITDYPRLEHGDVESPDMTALANYIKTMVGAGIITPDPALEAHLREVAHLPEATEPKEGAPDAQNQGKTPPDGKPTEEDTDDEEEPKKPAESVAKRIMDRLGRRDPPNRR